MRAIRAEERFDWTDDATLSRFRSLWDQGLSTSRIGEALGVSKNAIVGKAHRLGFPARPSPIQHRPDYLTREKKIRRAPTETLPKLTAIQPLKTTVAAIRARPGKVEPCNYPTETNSWPRYRLCGIPSIPGKPYCAHHCLSCFVAINSAEGKAIREAWAAIPPTWSKAAA